MMRFGDDLLCKEDRRRRRRKGGKIKKTKFVR